MAEDVFKTMERASDHARKLGASESDIYKLQKQIFENFTKVMQIGFPVSPKPPIDPFFHDVGDMIGGPIHRSPVYPQVGSAHEHILRQDRERAYMRELEGAVARANAKLSDYETRWRDFDSLVQRVTTAIHKEAEQRIAFERKRADAAFFDARDARKLLLEVTRERDHFKQLVEKGK